MTHYQILLFNPTRITFHIPNALNPATLFPDPDLQAPPHYCSGILAQAHSIRTDLKDIPISDVEITWFTDGSSYVQNQKRYAGATVTMTTEAIQAEPLPQRTSAQKTQLIVLTKALQIGKGKKLNIYTDSKYAFTTAYIHGPFYQERGLLRTEGKTIKNKQEILDFL